MPARAPDCRQHSTRQRKQSGELYLQPKSAAVTLLAMDMTSPLQKCVQRSWKANGRARAVLCRHAESLQAEKGVLEERVAGLWQERSDLLTQIKVNALPLDVQPMLPAVQAYSFDCRGIYEHR